MAGEQILEVIRTHLPDREDVERYLPKREDIERLLKGATKKKDEFMDWAGQPDSRIMDLLNRMKKPTSKMDSTDETDKMDE